MISIYIGNRTEWNPIRSVIIRVINEGLPGGGGGACSLVPYENLHLFPCSSKTN